MSTLIWKAKKISTCFVQLCLLCRFAFVLQNPITRKTMLGSGSSGSGDPKFLPENPLSISWHDSAWIPILNPHNVMDYFSERSNPFYERTCNNETIKMQRLNPEQMQNMQGTEYVLLHVQEPILYVIRKQHRQSPNHVRKTKH